MDGQIEIAFTRTMRYAYALVIINSKDDIILIGVDDGGTTLFQQYASAKRHVVRILIEIHIGVRRFALLGDLQQKRFCQSLIIREVNHLLMGTDPHCRVIHGEADYLLFFGIECTHSR